jgi:hypothetical protein
MIHTETRQCRPSLKSTKSLPLLCADTQAGSGQYFLQNVSSTMYGTVLVPSLQRLVICLTLLPGQRLASRLLFN